mmetsp:Transcript_8313/g.27965  ORF Transcript_8313/g.27965 Transcript_8313/m.27965 type:complete len:208 (-) Transcript_8313:1846-2469(-)
MLTVQVCRSIPIVLCFRFSLPCLRGPDGLTTCKSVFPRLLPSHLTQRLSQPQSSLPALCQLTMKLLVAAHVLLHPIQRQSVNRGCSSFFAKSKPSTLLCILHHKRAAIPHCKAADQSLPRRLRLLVSSDRLRDRIQIVLLHARLHLLLVLLQGQPHHLLLLFIQHQLLRDRLMQRKVLGRSILELTVSVRHDAREQRDPARHVPHRL